MSTLPKFITVKMKDKTTGKVKLEIINNDFIQKVAVGEFGRARLYLTNEQDPIDLLNPINEIDIKLTGAADFIPDHIQEGLDVARLEGTAANSAPESLDGK